MDVTTHTSLLCRCGVKDHDSVTSYRLTFVLLTNLDKAQTHMPTPSNTTLPIATQPVLFVLLAVLVPRRSKDCHGLCSTRPQ
eukprot:295830-Amphidinium_carterae.1